MVLPDVDNKRVCHNQYQSARGQARAQQARARGHAVERQLKNMETIYWTCGGVANMVNIIIVRLKSFFLGSHNSQEVTLPRKSQLPCAITFSSSHYPPLHLDWPHAPKKVDPSNYTGPMPPKSFKPGYRSKWQFYRNFEKTYIMTEVPQ